MQQAVSVFGPLNILCANAGITDESASYPIWKMPVEIWDKTYNTNVRGTFLTIKHFLRHASNFQQVSGEEVKNLAIVVTGSECGKFGQAGHSEYASGKAGLQYGLIRSVKNEIILLNKSARINAVAPGWVDTKLIKGRLDDPKEMWTEAQATVPLAKIAQPTDVARTVAFLASHRAAGHISGECISVDGGMEGRIVWKEEELTKETTLTPDSTPPRSQSSNTAFSSIPSSLAISRVKPKKPLIQMLVSVDFDAVSGWLGTGLHADNCMADYSSGFFSGQVGAPRLLKMFKRLGLSSNITWFIPGHSMESFPKQTQAIVDSGAEIALHGYCHEGAPQLTEQQEKEVLEKCISLAQELTGEKPRGYRAPLYQLRESTIKLLEEHGFLYDSSLAHHDSKPYLLPLGGGTPIEPPMYVPGIQASEWMHPLPQVHDALGELVEIPCNWYMEDMTPMQYWPHAENSQGYVDARVIEHMWKERFEFLLREQEDEDEETTKAKDSMTVFPLVLHPDTSGMAHVLPMIERFLKWAQEKGDAVEFITFGDAAERWKSLQY
jgi:NAD(P)-dependent dehydrogenase (short-subunit alcohol dehydrogenase family)/peptidoglycan/xylan/chitin deacetylase (PgdA/CDA1 family)